MWRLRGRIRPYAWGSRTGIATVQGREPSGGPEAELWFGAHPGDPSLLDDAGGRSLLDVITADPVRALGAEVAEIDDAARMAVARGFGRWEARIRDGLRAMHARGDLPAGADPGDLALATLAALQGGLLLAQVQRETRPLEVALDAMLDRIQALTERA